MTYLCVQYFHLLDKLHCVFSGFYPHKVCINPCADGIRNSQRVGSSEPRDSIRVTSGAMRLGASGVAGVVGNRYAPGKKDCTSSLEPLTSAYVQLNPSLL